MPRARGFTLIELLVVVAVIGVLIGVLLPALSRTQEGARAVVCQSNIRQVTLAVLTYASDNDDTIPGTYWQGPVDLDWSGRNNVKYINEPEMYRHPIEASVMADYISALDAPFECPTAKRLANTLFDYTMVIRMAGARTTTGWRASYALNPDEAHPEHAYFSSLPLLIEEHGHWYNESYDDGSWANKDQISQRHTGSAHMSFLDGSVIRLKPPSGPDTLVEEPRDLTARDFLVHVRRRIFPLWFSSPEEFGWINSPKITPVPN
jgi:prepilin-type N-terminal cleavage/methylation domain-containing protein/prepilin-type processing-associated H-X9-DG protein